MAISSLLVIHIGGGIAGLLSGAVAMSFRKGSRGHIVAGQIFVAAMLCMASAGTSIAMMKSQTGNILGGLVTLYMVSTAWAAARRPEGKTGMFEWAALVTVLAIGAVMFTFGVEAVRSPTGLKGGYPPPLYFTWFVIATLSAAGDVRMLVRGGLFGTQRMVRHLWRMCFGLFIASGSFFLGQQKVFPLFLRGLKIWFVPAFLPLLLMIYWLIRVRRKKTYQTAAPSFRMQSDGTSLHEQPISGRRIGAH